jgi:DNA polymerase III delta prime subunit
VWEHAQDRQRTKIQLRSNALQRKIESWCKFQLLYCPAVATLHAPSPKDNSASSIKPHLIPLWLPSQINGRVSVDASLVNIEWKLRHAQAYESLDSLRHYLQVRAYLYKFKDRFVRGQGANTRARNAINGVQAKIDATAAEYRAAYGALLLLSSQVFEFGWKNEILLLKDEDIRDLSEGKAERLGKKQSEGRRTISWIWKTVPADDLNNDDFMRESMFIFSSYFLSANISSKGFVLNGVNHEHAQIASQKRWLY